MRDSSVLLPTAFRIAALAARLRQLDNAARASQEGVGECEREAIPADGDADVPRGVMDMFLGLFKRMWQDSHTDDNARASLVMSFATYCIHSGQEVSCLICSFYFCKALTRRQH